MIPHLFDTLAVTPSDTADLVAPAPGNVAQDSTNPNYPSATVSKQRNLATALTVGVTGNVTYIDYLGNTQVLVATAGFTYCGRFTRIKATGTTATGITAYFPVFN